MTVQQILNALAAALTALSTFMLGANVSIPGADIPTEVMLIVGGASVFVSAFNAALSTPVNMAKSLAGRAQAVGLLRSVGLRGPQS